MLQSNSLTFLNVPKIFYKLYFCKKILTRADISFQVGGAMPYLKNILSHHKLNAFNTNICNNLVGVFFNFVKEFENKIGAFTAMPMRLLKNNFHCSTIDSFTNHNQDQLTSIKIMNLNLNLNQYE